MYTDWFKLKKLPFRLRPDPEFLYLQDATALAYEALRAAVTAKQKLVCLLGEPGLGKTTLLHALAREREGSAHIVRIQQPGLTSQELSATLDEQLGLADQDGAAHDPGARLKSFVASASKRGRPVVILVDEAHRCSSSMLQELLNLTAWTSAPLVVLAGEEELIKVLSSLELPAAAASVTANLRLTRLTQPQIPGYLNHRLRVAGSEGRELFEPDTFGEIFRYTGGTPQLINTLCDSALMFAESHNTARVGLIEIRDAVRELNWIEFSARRALGATVSGAAG